MKAPFQVPFLLLKGWDYMKLKKLCAAALFLALALLLPFVTGQLPSLGTALLPMHLPVLLCGFVCGPVYGALVGAAAPILRSFLFGMPPLFPTVFAMMFELCAYGAFAGLFYMKLPKKKISIYASLVFSMIAGRLVWGAVMAVLTSLGKALLTSKVFFSSVVLTGIPGIVLQLVLIPVLLIALEKNDLLPIGTKPHRKTEVQETKEEKTPAE